MSITLRIGANMFDSSRMRVKGEDGDEAEGSVCGCMDVGD